MEEGFYAKSGESWSAQSQRGSRMGKTVPSFRLALESEIGSWSQYRSALKKGDRRVFDELMGHTRTHASASGNAVRTSPFEAMLLSMLIEQQKALSRLKDRLDGLKRELEGLDQGMVVRPIPGWQRSGCVDQDAQRKGGEP